LEKAITVAISVAEATFGTTGGAAKPKIKRLSNQETKFNKQIRTLKTALNDLYRLLSNSGKPTSALLSLWSAGVLPELKTSPTTLQRLADPRNHAWAGLWMDVIRQNLADTKAELRQFQKDLSTQQATVARTKAIERMATPGSKEIRRWLGGGKEPSSSVFMRTDYPDTITIPGTTAPPPIDLLLVCAKHDITSLIAHSPEQTSISNIPPSLLHELLLTLEDSSCTLSCTHPDKLVEGDSDKLIAWEHYLAKEAIATKARCQWCLCASLLPLTRLIDGLRRVTIWCTSCNRLSNAVVQPED
jgi:hypothetical protein